MSDESPNLLRFLPKEEQWEISSELAVAFRKAAMTLRDLSEQLTVPSLAVFEILGFPEGTSR